MGPASDIERDFIAKVGPGSSYDSRARRRTEEQHLARLEALGGCGRLVSIEGHAYQVGPDGLHPMPVSAAQASVHPSRGCDHPISLWTRTDQDPPEETP